MKGITIQATVILCVLTFLVGFGIFHFINLERKDYLCSMSTTYDYSDNNISFNPPTGLDVESEKKIITYYWNDPEICDSVKSTCKNQEQFRFFCNYEEDECECIQK